MYIIYPTARLLATAAVALAAERHRCSQLLVLVYYN